MTNFGMRLMVEKYWRKPYIWFIKANSIVGGRVILIETLNNEKLIKFYEDNGFKILQKRIDKKVDKNTGKEIITEYVQMYRII